MLGNEIKQSFGDLVLVGRQPENRNHTTWFVECEHCQGRHIFRKQGAKIWHTSCILSGVEWTITPAEYFVQRPGDFSKILGSV